MNKKLTAALIAAGTLPFAAQALELSVEYDPSFGAGAGLIADTMLFASLDTVTGELVLGSERETALFTPLTADLTRVANNSLVVNLLTGETGFVRESGFTGEDGVTDLDSSFLITRAIAPNGDGTFDYASAFEASLDGDNGSFAASSDLAAFAGVSSAADVRAQIQAALGN
ncbi:MAG TPA: hypothetical protein QF361_05845 [Gammaproteobacteria bacterium]|nr:hypothetical protein [Gammaproteobacteria bacterium]